MDDHAGYEASGAPKEPAGDDAEHGGAQHLYLGAVEEGEDECRYDDGRPGSAAHPDKTAQQHAPEADLLGYRRQQSYGDGAQRAAHQLFELLQLFKIVGKELVGIEQLQDAHFGKHPPQGYQRRHACHRPQPVALYAPQLHLHVAPAQEYGYRQHIAQDHRAGSDPRGEGVSQHFLFLQTFRGTADDGCHHAEGHHALAQQQEEQKLLEGDQELFVHNGLLF